MDIPRFPADGEQDAIGARRECIKIEIDCRILAQLVLEPVISNKASREGSVEVSVKTS
jgi:hypothetical protein